MSARARSKTNLPTASRRHKILAILAAGTVVGVGATVTLAAWNDAEWINGSVGTTTFEVQQNVSTPWSNAAWVDAETAPGTSVTFAPGAMNLTPSEAVYAPVSLTTTPDSVAATSLTLAAATSAGTIASDVDGLLFSALQLRVVAISTLGAATPTACDVSLFTSTSEYAVGSFAAGVPLGTAGTLASELAAAGADKVDYCFEIALPAGVPDTLQGRQVTPQWVFIAESAQN